ncbi:MAG: N-acetyltransferase [Candidatus Eisenbacteria sp.]|nr:N-acetyltransferase [Candidatus Eisenbacteria bacterium]
MVAQYTGGQRVADIYIHPSGINESEQVGEGTRIWAFAHVMKGAIVGKHCNIGETSFIETGAVLGNFVTVKNGVSVWDLVTVEDYVFLGPHAVLTNDPVPRSHPDYKGQSGKWLPTRIREGATIGANATIVCGHTLNPWCYVGAGAVVTNDVPAHALVVGNPARQRGWVCRCGRRLPQDLKCADCGRAFRKEGEGLVPAK